MDSPHPYRHLPVFVLLILGVGSARFILTVAGLGNELSRYASMTVVIAAGMIWFGSVLTHWKQRVWIACALIAPYMLIETLGLGYTWISGRQTVFHAPEYSMGTSLSNHLVGHIVGGLTWEPLSVFVFLTILSGIFRLAGVRR